MDIRVVLFKTPDPRGVVETIINSFDKVLKEKGFETKIIEPDPENIAKQVEEIYQFKPLFMFDINLDGVIYAEQEGKKLPLSEVMGNMHITWFLDDPMVHWIKLKPTLASNQFVYLTIDMEHTQWLGSLQKNVAFLAPGVAEENIPPENTEKEFDLAFLGPVIEPKIIEEDWKGRFDNNLYIFAVELGRLLYRNPDMPIRFASTYLLSQFNDKFQQAMMQFQKEREDDFIAYLMEIGVYAMHLRRWNILENLDEFEINVLGPVKGDIKEHIVVYEDIVKDKDIITFFNKSKITLLSHPPFIPSGLGYSVFNALASNTLVLTEERFFTKSFFEDGKDLILYNPNDILDITSNISYYLEDSPEEREEIAKSGREKVLRGHTLKTRGEFVAEMMKDIVKKTEAELMEQQNQGKDQNQEPN